MLLGGDALGRAVLGQITTAQALVNAPPSTLGGPIAALAAIVAAAQPDPWVYLFHGGSQPFTPRKLAPQLSAVAVNPPPSTLGGPIAALASEVATAQPDPWVYLFHGGAQPFAPKKLSPGIPGQSGNNPPFAHPARSATNAAVVAIAQPNPWVYLFHGSTQPFAPKKLSPGIPGQSNNAPPSTFGGPIALKAQVVGQQQPDPWVYAFLGSTQPFAPRKLSPGIPGQSNNAPPFTLGGPIALKSQIVGQQQPDPWVYLFHGGLQPFAPKKLSPGIPGQDIDVPPFTHPSRSAAFRAIRTAWDPPPPDYQTVLYATIPEPQGGQTIVFNGSPAAYTITGSAIASFLLTGWLSADAPVSGWSTLSGPGGTWTPAATPASGWSASGRPVSGWSATSGPADTWTIELTRSNR